MPQYKYEVYTMQGGVLVPLELIDPPYTAEPAPAPYVPPAKVTGLTVTEVIA